MSVHSSLLFMLLFMRVTAGDAEDHSVQLQVTSCSAEINTPTLQRSFNAALDKSVANYESIKKAEPDCNAQHTMNNNHSIFVTIGCSCPQPCGMIKISLCLWTCYQHTRGNSTSKESSVCLSPTNETVLKAAVEILRFFGWSRVYALTDSINPRPVMQKFLNEASITVSENFGVSFEQDATYRIFILVQVNTTQALRALCDAYRQELFYSSGYAWVIVGVDVDELLNTTSTDMLLSMNCTLDMIKTVLNYTLVVEPAVTMAEHEAVLHDAFKVITTSVQPDNNCSNHTLSSEQLMENLQHVSFNGLTGNVLLQENGSRGGTVANIKQYRFDSQNTQQLQKFNVASVEKNRLGNYSVMYESYENLTTIWPDGIPSDEIVIDGTHFATFIVFSILYGILLEFDIICLLFTVIFKNRRVIKLTSPVLSYVLIFGVAFLGSAVIFYNVPIYSTSLLIAVCVIRPAPLIIGHDICFGIILLKLFRIHQIFVNSKPNKNVIKDWHLLLALAMIILIILVEYSILMPVGFTILADYHLTIDEEIPYTINNMGFKVFHFTYVCGTPTSDFVLIAVVVMNKFVMHTVAIVLAVRTRKIEVTAVNEAKEIHAMVYISTGIIILVAVITLTTDGFPNLQGSLVGIFVYIECITFIGLSFIPKMVYLWKDPKGKEIFKNMNRPPKSYAKSDSKSTV